MKVNASFDSIPDGTLQDYWRVIISCAKPQLLIALIEFIDFLIIYTLDDILQILKNIIEWPGEQLYLDISTLKGMKKSTLIEEAQAREACLDALGITREPAQLKAIIVGKLTGVPVCKAGNPIIEFRRNQKKEKLLFPLVLDTFLQAFRYGFPKFLMENRYSLSFSKLATHFYRINLTEEQLLTILAEELDNKGDLLTFDRANYAETLKVLTTSPLSIERFLALNCHINAWVKAFRSSILKTQMKNLEEQMRSLEPQETI